MKSRRFIPAAAVLAAAMVLAACASRPSGPRLALEDRPAIRPSAPADPAEDARVRAHAHFAAGVAQEINSDWPAALEHYYQAATGELDNEWLVLEVSRKLIQNRSFDRAYDLLRLAADRPEATGAVHARLGIVCSQLGKFAEAASADRAAIQRAPESIAGYHNLFLNFIQENKNADALAVLESADRVKAAGAEFLLALAELYVNYGTQDPPQRGLAQARALAAFRRADGLRPAEPTTRLRLADGLNAQGDSARAAELYLELIHELPDVPLVRERVHARLAEIYLKSSDHQAAGRQLRALLKDNPVNPRVYYYLGGLAFEEKDAAAAAEYFRQSLLLDPEFEPAYYELALAQLGLDQPANALATLDSARRKFPRSFVMEMLTGMSLSRQKAYAQALTHYTAAEVMAQATDPARLNRDFYFQLGSVCERLGDVSQAEKYFEKCLAIAPDFDAALNYLGYMWAERGIRLERARELIERALQIEPDNPAYLDSLGWVLYKLSQPRAALAQVLKAIERSPDPDATLYDHLGEIYAVLKEPALAREAWLKSLAVEESARVREKLEALSARP